MFKEGSYDQIFTQKTDRNNIQIIKKFVVFQPSHQTQNKQSFIRNHELPSPEKRNRFPAGFLTTNRPHQTLVPEEDSLNMQVNCKKVPTNQIHSFLLGLTNRINRQAENQILQQQRSISKTSPDRRVRYDEVIKNLSRIRKEGKFKPIQLNLANSQNKNKAYSQTDKVRQTQLPIIQKKTSSVNKKQTQASSPMQSPLLKNHQSEIMGQKQCEGEKYIKRNSYGSCASQRRSSGYATRFRNNQSIMNMAKISQKNLKLPDQPKFMKGYLSYHMEGKQFLKKEMENIKQPPKHPININITAKSYIAVDRKNLQVLVQRNSDKEIQIASLTKIMTCYLCLLACDKYKVNPKEVSVRVSDKAAEMPGTSAELQAGDLLTLNDLFYGLMLPSGNDASVAIAEAVGKIIQRHKKKPTSKSYYQTFIAHMNLLARQIKIDQTFQNSSGLAFNPNFSTAKAISILTALALLNQKFRQIINTRQYQVQIKNERFGLIRKSIWKNTNKLLWKGWDGVKTGTTETAGHCLMSCKDDLIISVYDCETLSKRFTECIKIYDFLQERKK